LSIAGGDGRRELTRDAIAPLDPTGQLADVLDFPEHLRDALWRFESANLTPHDSPAGLVIAGMGGSGIGGALAIAVLGDRAMRPIVGVRDYTLPPWTAPDTTVLCCSYSGQTEETLAAYEAAGVIGAHRIVCTTGGRLADAARADGVPVVPLPGGYQPRATVGYTLVVALEVAALVGVSERLHTEIDVAAAHATELAAQWGPDAAEDSLAKGLARSLLGTIPLIAGADLTAPIAYRFKTQINENAKLPCFYNVLPELDHNELVGWEGAPELGRFSVVLLDDSDLHPRVRSRIELTEEQIAAQGVATHRLATVGETRIERLVSLVALGDLVSVYLAILTGVDPAAIASLELLKQALADT
jgi:glucose/mannose-6-phosphate isomerase